MLGASWKTTAAGIGAILGSIASVLVALWDGKPETSPIWEVALAGVLAGVGLIFAKDSNVSNAPQPVALAKVVPPAP